MYSIVEWTNRNFKAKHFAAIASIMKEKIEQAVREEKEKLTARFFVALQSQNSRKDVVTGKLCMRRTIKWNNVLDHQYYHRHGEEGWEIRKDMDIDHRCCLHKASPSPSVFQLQEIVFIPSKSPFQSIRKPELASSYFSNGSSSSCILTAQRRRMLRLVYEINHLRMCNFMKS